MEVEVARASNNNDAFGRLMGAGDMTEFLRPCTPIPADRRVDARCLMLWSDGGGSNGNGNDSGNDVTLQYRGNRWGFQVEGGEGGASIYTSREPYRRANYYDLV